MARSPGAPVAQGLAATLLIGDCRGTVGIDRTPTSSGTPSRPVGLLVVALLIVLSGCSDGFTGTLETPAERTVTPAPVPTDSEPDAPFPPGVSFDGVTDASRLEGAHFETLTDTNFVERARTTVRFENGSLAIEETYTGRHGTNASSITLRRNGTDRYPILDASLVEAGVWGNDSFSVVREATAHGQVDFDAFAAPGIFYRRPRGGYGLVFDDTETVLESRRVVNGSVEYVVVAEGVDTRGPWYYRGSFMRARDDGRARAVVTPDGTIRRFVVEFPIVVEDRNATLRHTYVVEFRTVVVTRPAWFEAAVTRGAPPPPPRVREAAHHLRGVRVAVDSAPLHASRRAE